MRYVGEEIEANKVIFFNARNEIDRILTVVKYSIEGITNLELAANGWNDKNSLRVGRGTKDMGTFLASTGGKDTAILFRSEQIVTAIYYIPEYMLLTLDSVNTNGTPLHIGTIDENGVTYTLPNTHNETLHATRVATFSDNDIFIGWGYSSNLSLDNPSINPVTFTINDIGVGYLDAVIEPSFIDNVDSAYFKLYGEIWLAEPELTNGGGYFYSGTFNVYEHQDNYTIYANVYGAVWTAQTFTPAETHFCQAVKLYLAKPLGGTLGIITVSIRATNGAGQPTGVDLATATIDESNLDANPDYFLAPFSTPKYLVKSTKYAIIIRCSGGDASHYLNVAFNESGGYTDGSRLTSTDSGSNFTINSSYDLLFADEG
jgi:hypothetical protein